MRTRLKGDDLTALRLQRFDMDGWRCRTCGRKVDDDLPDWHPRKAQLRHIEGRGRGGSDTIENTETSCGECHFRWEHTPKAIRRKR